MKDIGIIGAWDDGPNLLVTSVGLLIIVFAVAGIISIVLFIKKKHATSRKK